MLEQYYNQGVEEALEKLSATEGLKRSELDRLIKLKGAEKWKAGTAGAALTAGGIALAKIIQHLQKTRQPWYKKTMKHTKDHWKKYITGASIGGSGGLFLDRRSKDWVQARKYNA